MRRRRDLLLFGAALALRVVHLVAVRPGPLFRYLFIDSEFYDAVGRRLAAGDGFPDGVFFMNVLYGAFLGAVYTVFGGGETGRTAALAIQAVAGAGSVVLLARLGDALGRPRDGLVAAILLAALGPAIFYDAALLTPSLLLLLTTGATLVAVRLDVALRSGPAAGGRESIGAPLLLGVLTGLLVLGRASHALLLPAWIARLARHGRRGARAAVLVVVAATLPVLPATVRNWRLSGELVPVTANGGMALWAGNHEGATGVYSEPDFLSNPVPEREAEDYRLEASRRAGSEVTLAESSTYWTRETLARWVRDPVAAVRLASRKLQLYFHATESQTNLSYYFARDFSPLLDVLRLHLGWILPFAIVGLATELRPLLVPAIPIAVSLLTCLLFYVSSEYRHPVVPELLLFAVAGARRVAGPWRDRGTVRRVLVTAGMAALLVGVNARDALLSRLQSRRVDYLNFATLAASANRLDEAERFARESVALDPTWPPSRRKLAEILQRQGRVGEAGEETRAAGVFAGEPTSAALEVALSLFRENRFEEARDAFLALAATGDEVRATALNNAGLCSMRLGHGAEAESLFEASRAADPLYASPVIHLGRLALSRSDRAAAAAWARRALELAPDDGRARRVLARATGESWPEAPDDEGDQAD